MFLHSRVALVKGDRQRKSRRGSSHSRVFVREFTCEFTYESLGESLRASLRESLRESLRTSLRASLYVRSKYISTIVYLRSTNSKGFGRNLQWRTRCDHYHCHYHTQWWIREDVMRLILPTKRNLDTSLFTNIVPKRRIYRRDINNITRYYSLSFWILALRRDRGNNETWN